VNKGDHLVNDSLTAQGVWRVVEKYSDVAPHDLRRYAEFRIMPNCLKWAASAVLFDAGRAA
jgi:hypothetical protein